MEKAIDFESEEVAPKTEEDWDAVFKEALSLVERHVRPMMLDADDADIPRQIMVIQLFTIATNGLVFHDWTEKDILERVSKHDFEKIIAKQAQEREEAKKNG
jgi:hypothetical protein